MMPSRLCLMVVLALGSVLAEAAEPRIVNEGGIRDEWMLAEGVQLVAPGYPAEHAVEGANACVAIAYLINPDGTTSDYSLVRAWTRKQVGPEYWPAFAQAAALALAQWRFQPRPEISAPRPTLTVATMTFIGHTAEDPARLRAHCKVDDLARTMRDLRKGQLELNRGQAERDYRAPRASQLNYRQGQAGGSQDP